MVQVVAVAGMVQQLRMQVVMVMFLILLLLKETMVGMVVFLILIMLAAAVVEPVLQDQMQYIAVKLKAVLEVMERLTQFQELLLHMQEEEAAKVCNGQAVQVGVPVVLEAPEAAAKAVDLLHLQTEELI